MIFGDTSSVAIECSLLGRSDSFVYCDFSFWIGGRKIGQPGEESVLGVLIHSAAVVMKFTGERRLDVTNAMNAESLCDFMEKVTQSDDPNLLHQSLEGHYLQRYCLHTIADDAVGSAFQVAVVDYPDGRQRVVWKSHGNQSVSEINVPKRTIDERLAAFMAWAERV